MAGQAEQAGVVLDIAGKYLPNDGGFRRLDGNTRRIARAIRIAVRGSGPG
jgi:hypothetical protein